MKTKIVVVLLVLTCAISAKAQNTKQNGFTVTQCHTDQAQWLAKLVVPNQAGTQSILAGALLSWTYEINQCVNIDEGKPATVSNRSKRQNW